MASKRAVVIGIDEYSKLPDGQQLKGCVNDARLMQTLLINDFEFPEDNVRLLTNGDATREGILAAWRQLLDETETDDIVALHYSGHGSWAWDEGGDEGDGKDETIMPSDSGRSSKHPNTDIVDDQIHLFLLELGQKTRNITLTFDCCHSGSITRSTAEGSRPRHVQGAEKGDPLPPPIDPEELEKLEAAWKQFGPSKWLPISDRYVLVAGCRDEELSWEHTTDEGVIHGAMTFHLCAALRRAGPNTSFRDVFERMSAEVQALGQQHPQLEGSIDREIFGTRDFDAGRYLLVTARDGDRVTVAGGAAHGVTRSSVWSVLDPGGRTDGEPLGSVEIESVGAVESTARIVEEAAPDTIGPASRVVETAHSYGDGALGVWMAPPVGVSDAGWDALPERIDARPLLRCVDNEVDAEIVLHLLGPRSTSEGMVVPQIERLDDVRVAALFRDGELRMEPKTIDDEDLIKNLEIAARYRLALSLQNPGADDLRDKVTVELRRRRPDMSWVSARPDPTSGIPVFEPGDSVSFHINNETDKDLYLNLLDFGLSGAVARLHPPAGARERIVPGKHIFTKDFWDLSFPKSFPWTEHPYGASPTEGTEVFKFYFSTAEADLSIAEGTGFRSASTLRGPQLQSLWDSMTGRTTRDATAGHVVDEVEDEWFAIDRPFLVRRRTGTDVLRAAEPVQVGSAWISSPNARLHVEARGMGSDVASAGQLEEEPLSEALVAAGVRTVDSVEVAAETGPDGMSEVALDLEDPGSAFGQVLLSSSEGGVMTWHFAEPAPSGPATRSRGATHQRFVISGRSAQSADPAAPKTRGLLGAVGKRFIKVLAFKVLDEALEEAGRHAVGLFEQKRRPNRVRTFTPENFNQEEAPGLVDAAGWAALSEGPALLMVHGTNSRSSSAFQSMPPEFVGDLHHRYEGRVFALDHFTFSHSPSENVAWFLGQIPDDTRLNLDIVCHSRGGLVSRALAEQAGALAGNSRSVSVGKVVFAGAPNAGTALADAKHVGKLLDAYTNLLNFFPDNGITDAVEAIVYAVKTFAVAGAAGLPGLQAMIPGGDFLTGLIRAQAVGDTRFYGLASDYEPEDAALRMWAADALADQVFEGASNDLVVPTDSVFGNDAARLPMVDRHVFAGADSVGHSGYFGNAVAREKIMGWLSA